MNRLQELHDDEEKQKLNHLLNLVKFLGNLFIGVIAFLCYNIYNEVHTLTITNAVQQDKVANLERRVDRLESYHVIPVTPVGKHEETITLAGLKKSTSIFK